LPDCEKVPLEEHVKSWSIGYLWEGELGSWGSEEEGRLHGFTF
jgi:hypothetical protein